MMLFTVASRGMSPLLVSLSALLLVSETSAEHFLHSSMSVDPVNSLRTFTTSTPTLFLEESKTTNLEYESTSEGYHSTASEFKSNVPESENTVDRLTEDHPLRPLYYTTDFTLNTDNFASFVSKSIAPTSTSPATVYPNKLRVPREAGSEHGYLLEHALCTESSTQTVTSTAVENVDDTTKYTETITSRPVSYSTDVSTVIHTKNVLETSHTYKTETFQMKQPLTVTHVLFTVAHGSGYATETSTTSKVVTETQYETKSCIDSVVNVKTETETVQVIPNSHVVYEISSPTFTIIEQEDSPTSVITVTDYSTKILVYPTHFPKSTLTSTTTYLTPSFVVSTLTATRTSTVYDSPIKEYETVTKTFPVTSTQFLMEYNTETITTTTEIPTQETQTVTSTEREKETITASVTKTKVTYVSSPPPTVTETIPVVTYTKILQKPCDYSPSI